MILAIFYRSEISNSDRISLSPYFGLIITPFYRTPVIQCITSSIVMTRTAYHEAFNTCTLCTDSLPNAVCSRMCKRDGKHQREGSSTQAFPFWFYRRYWLVIMALTPTFWWKGITTVLTYMSVVVWFYAFRFVFVLSPPCYFPRGYSTTVSPLYCSPFALFFNTVFEHTYRWGVLLLAGFCCFWVAFRFLTANWTFWNVLCDHSISWYSTYTKYTPGWYEHSM